METARRRDDGETSTVAESVEDTVVFRLPDDHRYNLKLLELNSKGPIEPPPLNQDYMRRNALGFYNNFTDVNGDDKSTWISRNLASIRSPFVVGLSSQGDCGNRNCSGILVEYNGTKIILTSAYIILGAEHSEIDILFPDRQKAIGIVSFFDELHNVALISADLANYKTVCLSREPPSPLATFDSFGVPIPLDAEVMAMGRNSIFRLMASRGKIKSRNDKLASDDLISCTCTISESGIGGPIIDGSSGLILGMSVYMQKKSSLFMPTTILTHCLEQLLDYGRVMRPWFGMHTKSLSDLKLDELELIYQSSSFNYGIVVKEVTKGSPGEEAGILAGDIIISCNGLPLRSSVQLAELLLTMGRSHYELEEKERSIEIEVEIKRPSTRTKFDIRMAVRPFSPCSLNKWPVLPLDVGDDDCDIILFSSLGDDPKTNDIWSPEKLQSKFTCLYQEGSSISSINGPVPRRASVLTCEEFEQSMPLEVGGESGDHAGFNFGGPGLIPPGISDFRLILPKSDG